MNSETRREAFEHAQKEFPRESCGLVVIASGLELYIPCRNLAERLSDFIMDPEDYARAEDMGDVVGVVHSHPNVSSKPSQADLVACEKSGLPWHIVSVPGGIWETITPAGYRAPYIGRQFAHGILDCYTLVRDWFAGERGITLPDFDRSEEWWNRGQSLYMENFRKAGFEIADDGLLPGDVILMQIRSKVPNHAAVYLGNDVILHHLQGRLSCRDVYGGYWRKNTFLIIRHGGAKT